MPCANISSAGLPRARNARQALKLGFPATPSSGGLPGPAKNHLQIKSSQKRALPWAEEENLFSDKYLAGKGEGSQE